MKVILNKCYGGFFASKEAYELYAKKKGVKIYWYDYDIIEDIYRKIDDVDVEGAFYKAYIKDFGRVVTRPEFDIFKEYRIELDEDRREDPTFIEVVEELGPKKASDTCSRLVVVNIPDGMEYVIDNYDGIEMLHEDVPVW